MSIHPHVHAEQRRRMIEELRVQNVASEHVLDAVGRVAREFFVPEGLVERAYENRALPIGEGQTISQPLVVAMMTDCLALSGTENVLEVGTGSGYQAAVLAELAATVHTIERSAKLHAEARERLERLGYRNVTCHLGDGTQGLPEEAPFDAICVTAGSPHIPQPLRDQLAPGGRLVIPVGQRKQQALRCITRSPDGERSEDVTHVVFVPLVGEHGWPEERGKRGE